MLPRGKLQLAPFLNPLTRRAWSIAELSKIAPLTGTLVLYSINCSKALKCSSGEKAEKSGQCWNILRLKALRDIEGRDGSKGLIKSS